MHVFEFLAYVGITAFFVVIMFVQGIEASYEYERKRRKADESKFWKEYFELKAAHQKRFDEFNRDFARRQAEFAHRARQQQRQPTPPYQTSIKPVWWAAILGVSNAATESDIQKAYRSKAKTAHPDLGGSEDAMKRLNMARTAALKERVRA